MPRELRNPLAFLLATALVSGAVIMYCLMQTDDVIETYRDASAGFRLAVMQADRSIESSEFSENEWPEFERLQSSGHIGAVDRLAWLEAFDDIGQSMSEFKIDYEMAPAELLQLSNTGLSQVNVGKQEPVVSLVRLTLSLSFIHDADLYQFFDALYRKMNVFFTIEEIEIDLIQFPLNQTTAAEEIPDSQWRIEVVCQIHWYTLTPPDSSPPVDS